MTKEEISFFDTIAPSWDGMERLSTPGKVNEILDIIGVEKGMDVLDLGTGTGVLLPFLSERIGSEGHILAVDISEGMLSGVTILSSCYPTLKSNRWRAVMTLFSSIAYILIYIIPPRLCIG